MLQAFVHDLQAHHNAATHSEEFVVELLVSLDKMGTLVQNLLVIEAWKQMVLPHLKKHLANKVEPTMSYIVLYHECAVANLLEVSAGCAVGALCLLRARGFCFAEHL